MNKFTLYVLIGISAINLQCNKAIHNQTAQKSQTSISNSQIKIKNIEVYKPTIADALKAKIAFESMVRKDTSIFIYFITTKGANINDTEIITAYLAILSTGSISGYQFDSTYSLIKTNSQSNIQNSLMIEKAFHSINWQSLKSTYQLLKGDSTNYVEDISNRYFYIEYYSPKLSNNFRFYMPLDGSGDYSRINDIFYEVMGKKLKFAFGF
jgi:hypothetical protein